MIAGASLAETVPVILLLVLLGLLLLFACLETRFGLEAILGAFSAGAALKIADRDEAMTHSLLYRRLGLPGKQVVAAGLLQATSLSLPAVAGTIGVDLGLMKPETYVALITAGLISVLAFPSLAMRLGRRTHQPQTIEAP